MAKVTRTLALYLLNKFLKEDRLSELKGALWGKEIGLIGQIYLNYPCQEFWEKLVLFNINSFAYFKTIDGKYEIEKQWRLFMLDKAIEKDKNKPKPEFTIDIRANPPILEKNKSSQEKMVDWIDRI